MMNKKSPSQTENRQKAIAELVKKKVIGDQKQLVLLLKQEYQIEANQAVVSRDLRKLGVVKKMINGSFLYEMPEIDVRAELLKLALIDMNYNESTIVMKTHPGLAGFVGDCVDEYDDLDVLGCLAGENVVFVAPKSTKNIHKTYEKLCDRFCFNKKEKKLTNV
jgi:transcriptional regulator of arginine metabolism